MSRWCSCKVPKTRNLASRRCLLCAKLIRLKQKDRQIPNWQIIKDPSLNNCCFIDFGKRITKYNPKLYWVRYAGTKKAPEVYVYAIERQAKKIECPYGNEESSKCQYNKKGFCTIENPDIKSAACLSWKQRGESGSK